MDARRMSFQFAIAFHSFKANIIFVTLFGKPRWPGPALPFSCNLCADSTNRGEKR